MKFFIPARKGSERIHEKNICHLHGKPLINYTFDAVKEVCGNPKDVIVSTDDESVLWMAHGYDFRSIVRPSNLCESSSKMNDVLFHHEEDFCGEDVVVLYPTNPFRGSIDITRALNAWESAGGSGTVLMSVEEVLHRPYGLMKIDQEDGMLCLANPKGVNYYQAQGQPPLYRANGAIYIIANDVIVSKGLDPQLFGPKTFAHVMGKVVSMEVDDKADLEIAEAMMRRGVRE